MSMLVKRMISALEKRALWVGRTDDPRGKCGRVSVERGRFCSNTLWGGLNVGLIIDPRTEKRFSKNSTKRLQTSNTVP